jgi:hypothetical protein
MKKKEYYTPSIEEFHIGFEYEASDLADDLVSTRWVEETFDWNNDFVLFPFTIFKDRPEKISELYRVKYLDKEDIESFGFEKSNRSDSLFLKRDCFNYRPENKLIGVGVNFNAGYDHVLIFIIPDPKKVPAGVTVFAGNIKNKSELRRLLQQLGIN